MSREVFCLPAIEEITIEPVPAHKRHGKVRDLFTLWFSANMQLTTVATGAVLATFGLSLPWIIVAIVLGNCIGAIFMAYHSAQGPIIGIPQMIQSRAQFGFFGALLPIFIIIVMYMGFWASSAVLGGEAVSGLFSSGTSIGILAVFVVVTVLAIFGYDAIHKFQRYLAIIFLVAFVLLTVSLFAGHNLTAKALSSGSFSWPLFVLALSIPLSWQITYAPYVSDYSRYLPEDSGVSRTFWATFGGTVIASVWMMTLGALLVLFSSKMTQVAALGSLSGVLAPLTYLVILCGILAANVLNSYGGMLSIDTFIRTFANLKSSSVRRLSLILFICVVGTAVALFAQSNFLGLLGDFILLLLYLAIPWTAINLSDFYILRHGRYDQEAFFRPAGYGAVNWAAIVAYVIGALAELPFIDPGVIYEGPIAKAMGGADIAWIPGIIISAGLYLLLMRGRVREESQASS